MRVPITTLSHDDHDASEDEDRNENTSGSPVGNHAGEEDGGGLANDIRGVSCGFARLDESRERDNGHLCIKTNEDPTTLPSKNAVSCSASVPGTRLLTRFVLERRSEAHERGWCILVRTRLFLFSLLS